MFNPQYHKSIWGYLAEGRGAHLLGVASRALKTSLKLAWSTWKASRQLTPCSKTLLQEAVLNKKKNYEGWRDSSAGKSTGWSSQGPRFNSQQGHGSSQVSVTPVLGASIPSQRHTCKENTLTHWHGMERLLSSPSFNSNSLS